MKITRKREILITRERRLTIRSAAPLGERFCRTCAAQTRFVTVDEAAIARRVTSREIYRLVEENRIHHAETGEGFLLVCFASLGEANRIQLFTVGNK